MEDRQKIIEKLVKIKSLAERGVGGEQQTAQQMYEVLKKRYGITDEEVNRAAVPVDISGIDLKKFWGISFRMALIVYSLNEEQMMEELQALYVRKAYLESLLKEYESPEAGGFYTDKIVHMIVPKSMEERQQEEDCGMEHQQCADPEGSKSETYKTAMKSVIKSSPFERAMKVEAELNKLHGRIIKQLDSIKAYELEDRRLQLAEKQLELNKQKLTGEFEINPDGSTENDEITDVVDDV